MLKKIYAVFMTLVFTALCLAFTADGPDKFIILKNRFIITFIFFGPGMLLLIFNKSVGKFIFKNQIKALKPNETEEDVISQSSYMGKCMFFTGVLISFAATILFLFN